ncbi:MAG: glycosyltransferase family 8 protein [Erysipelotrichaceae bacterium]|jgi:lipopolysaccharide biosynthesis glycosyltransferase
MNILISVNKQYIDKARTMLLSLSLQVNENVTVYLMNHSLNDDAVADLKKYLENKCNFNFVEIDVKKTALDNLPVYLHMSIETYYRLLAQFLLPASVDRILWLDADIIILKDITDFYYQDFAGKLLVGCPDVNYNRKDILEIKEKIGISKQHIYFNAGVILFNLEQLRTETSEKEIVKTCQKLQSKVVYMDQDILNYLYQNKIKYENSEKFNFQLTNKHSIDEMNIDEIHILHYSGPRKPWNYKDLNRSSKHYWNIRIKQGYILEYLKVIFSSFAYRVIGKIKRFFKKKSSI